MATTLLHVARAFTPTSELADAGILIRDGVIEAIGPRSGFTVAPGSCEVSATDKTAAPGFIDVHIHGAGGHDVMEASETALRAIAATIGAHGTTSFLAQLWRTAPVTPFTPSTPCVPFLIATPA